MDINESMLQVRKMCKYNKDFEAEKVIRGYINESLTTREEILLCAFRGPCQFQDDIKCTTLDACTEQRKFSTTPAMSGKEE